MTIKALLPSNWEDMNQMERTKWLENVSDKIERGKFVSKPLTESEKEELRDQLEDTSKKLYDVEDKYSDIKKEYNEKLKNLRGAVREAVTGLRNNYVRVETDVYHIRDYEMGVLYEIAPDGSKVDERRLTAEERQKTLSGEQREASNQ